MLLPDEVSSRASFLAVSRAPDLLASCCLLREAAAVGLGYCARGDDDRQAVEIDDIQSIRQGVHR